MKKKIQTLKLDAEAERFVDTADLSKSIFRLEAFENEESTLLEMVNRIVSGSAVSGSTIRGEFVFSERLTDRMKLKSAIMTEGEHAMIKSGMRPVYPGEILFEEFMKPAEPPINVNILVKALEVPANRITAFSRASAVSRAIPRSVWLRYRYHS